MISFPNAKINIGLNITEKRADGFHNIESVFYPINLADILEINPSENLIFKNTGLLIENGDFNHNLCFKAFQFLQKDFAIPPVQIHLHKIIPSGAGLGGGSSDASFMLKLLNQVFELKLNTNQLEKYAGQIGSDCPFFITNQPAYVTEKGNNIKPLSLNLKGYFIVLVHPGIHINTGQAYSKIKPAKPENSLKELINQPIEKWKNLIKNDFESVVFKEFDDIRKIKEKLYDSGALYASMSGSGSSVYGIFNEKTELKNLFPDYFVWGDFLT